MRLPLYDCLLTQRDGANAQEEEDRKTHYVLLQNPYLAIQTMMGRQEGFYKQQNEGKYDPCHSVHQIYKQYIFMEGFGA